MNLTINNPQCHGIIQEPEKCSALLAYTYLYGVPCIILGAISVLAYVWG